MAGVAARDEKGAVPGAGRDDAAGDRAAAFRFASDVHKGLQNNIIRRAWQAENAGTRYRPTFSMCEGDFCSGREQERCTRTCIFLPANAGRVQDSEMRRLKCSEAQALNRCTAAGRPLELNGRFFWCGRTRIPHRRAPAAPVASPA